MYGFIKDLIIAAISCFLGAYLNNRYTKRINEKESEKINKYKRYDFLKSVYCDLRKFLRALPIYVPEDILKELDTHGFYSNMTIDEALGAVNSSLFMTSFYDGENKEMIAKLTEISKRLNKLEEDHLKSNEFFFNFNKTINDKELNKSIEELELALKKLIDVIKSKFELGELDYQNPKIEDYLEYNSVIKTREILLDVLYNGVDNLT